ncbi:transporter [Rosettibacter firmus]|uniref:transporter n=1 Tax=Rosettibacter firmus TaxID=3111522 RepID=UPI00336BE798
MRHKNKLLPFALYIVITLTSSSLKNYAQEGWSLKASLQFSGGNYSYNNSSKIFYFYGEASYQKNNWSFNVSVPVVAQNAGGVGQVGGMMLPNGNNDEDNHYNMMTGNENNSNFMNNHSMSSFNHFGLGDISLYGSYNIFEDNASLFSLSLNSFFKIPTASYSLGLGTGKFDLGISATIRKMLDSYIGFLDLGYIEIGDPPNIKYNNPLSIGLGLGKFFDEGNYSLLLYYQAYTKIIDGYPAPQLLSLGFNYKINSSLTLSLIGAAGLSKITSNFSFSSGLEWNL